MTAYSVISALLRLLGLVRAADALWRAHELRVKAREIADAPTTRAELEETLERGELRDPPPTCSSSRWPPASSSARP